MRQTIDKLGELYLTCSTHLFQNFARTGIAPWWQDKATSPKGAAIFVYYDAVSTCMRVLPNSPKFFQAAVKNGLISITEAKYLERKLTSTVKALLEKYSGFFAADLKAGPVGSVVRRAFEPDEFGLQDAHQNLPPPDELYACVPWPCIPNVHFSLNGFANSGIESNYIEEAAYSPLRAITMAIDLVALGPSINVPPEAIATVLDWLKDRAESSHKSLSPDVNHRLKKIVVPAYAGGLQGLVFGVFCQLRPEQEAFVVSQLHQFASTLGDHVARYRQDLHLPPLRSSRNLAEYASNYMHLLPPVEHAIFAAGNDIYGFNLNREAEYYAGYFRMSSEAARCALDDPLTACLNEGDAHPDTRVYVKMPVDAKELSPVFTLMRIRPPSVELMIKESTETEPLSRSELGMHLHGLRRKINGKIGANAASKKLFLLDLVLQNYERGHVTLSNQRARDYIRETLGKPITGYHVAGKAAQKFEEDIRKLLPNRFFFERLSTHALRVRWNPKDEQYRLEKKAERSPS
jgi:hypothetical protein